MVFKINNNYNRIKYREESSCLDIEDWSLVDTESKPGFLDNYRHTDVHFYSIIKITQ